jgi:alkanesulfonate monooxygenase SsuD/methylene tetrahydromethanopterin reductase-like flavin-dependent oxidoreductase (luciferase family)
MGDRVFNLGLGTSGKLLMQKYHGVEFDRPVSRLRETIHVIDKAFRTGNLPTSEKIFPLEDMPLGVAADRDRLKIYVAGLSDRTIEVVGQDADGWLPIWFSSERGRPQLELVETTAAAAGRPRPAIGAFLYGSVGSNPKYYEYTRDTLAWYVAAQGTAYRHLFERYGYEKEMENICQLWQSGDRRQARRQTPEYMVNDTALLGTPEVFLAQVDRFIKAGIDRPILRLQSQPTAAQTLEMLASLGAYEADGDD